MLDYHCKLEHTTKSQDLNGFETFLWQLFEVWQTSYANFLSLCPAQLVSLHLDVELSIKETVLTGRSLQIFWWGVDMEWPLDHVKQV